MSENAMARKDYNKEQIRKGLEREAIEVEDSVVRIENKIYHKELYEALPWRAILSNLSEDEKRLLSLAYIDERSPNDIAEVLGENVSTVSHDLHKLTIKLRNRIRNLLRKDEAANKLLLTWEQIQSKHNRVSS